MAAAIAFHFDTSQAERALDQLGKRAPVVMARALNRTATSVRAVMARDIAGDIGLRVGTVRDELKVRLAAGGEQLTAAVSVSGARIPLSKFTTDGALKRYLPSRGRGTVRVKGKTYPGAFVAQMRSSHVGVFRRTGASTRKSPGAWGKNLPIVELKGPSLPHVFEKHVAAGIARGEEQLVKNLEHEIGFELSQVAG